MNNRQLQDKTGKLTESLKQLTVKQEEISQDINNIKIEVITITEALRTQEIEKQECTTVRHEIIQGTEIYLGDTVEIINPSRGQERKGKTIGRIKDGLMKMLMVEGKKTRRLPKN